MIEYILAFIALISLYDYITFFLVKRRLKGKVKVQKGMKPFLFKGNKTGILLIHGFSTSPAELREIGRFLHKQKYTVYAPLLPGHGTTPEMLAVTKWQQWVIACEEAIERLKDSCKTIWVIGYSIGGNLALLSVNKSKKIKGVVALSTPIFYKRKHKWAKILFPLVRRIKFFQKKVYSPKLKERLNRSEREDAYNIVPLRSVTQLVKVIKESKKAVKDIRKDILVCQANPDDIMDVQSGEFIYNTVKSKKKKIMWIHNSFHTILLDPLHKKKVYKRVYKFIKYGK